LPGLDLRSRFKVLDGSSGEHYGTYYGDEGYSTLDPVSLAGLIGSRIAPGELRIVKLDWSNFDEVEVHVQVEEILRNNLEDDVKVLPGGPDFSNGLIEGKMQVLSGGHPRAGSLHGGKWPVSSSPGIRYTIYDRRTIQPMGEYVPEGDRSRIDRLTLYKMFPEYEFKTFEIDSIRWEAEEVRIFVRAEKKKSPVSEVQSPKEDHKRRDLLKDN
jgi:hypothetical protein